MVVDQSAEWLLPKPEVRSLNLVIGKFLQLTYLLLSVEKTKIKDKETENGKFFKPNLKGNESNSLLRIYILQIALSNFVVFLYLLF